MIPIGVRDLDAARAGLFDRRCRVVAWGSGSVFDYFHERFPIRLEYLIDNDRGRWGQSRRGVSVSGPERLLREEPARTVVVIYSSAWPEIQRQIAEIGPFQALPASAVFADLSVRETLATAEALAERQPSRSPSARNTIVVQGPVLKDVTARVLRVLSALHPGNLILLSTWAHTSAELLAEVSEIADDVVLSEAPAVTGIQNRNKQLQSTRAGVDRAIEHGAQTILKTRTDLAVLTESLFEKARWWLDRVGADSARRAGLNERLIVPASYTRKYLLYHPSDLVMLGNAEDMAAYWSAPLDPRSGELLSTVSIDQPLAAVNMNGNPTESYLGLSFCRTLDRAAAGTLADSWAFYRDLFAVVDNGWFDLLWFKNLSIPDASLRSGVRQMVTQSFWGRLHLGDPSVDLELGELDPRQVALRALAGAA